MALQWTNRTPERPDRYIDWDLVNRGARGEAIDGWCPVLIQMWPQPGATPEAHLERLEAELPGLLSTATPTVNASDSERALLAKRIHELKNGLYVASGNDDPGLSFFVYMPEHRIYANGGYADTNYYTIRYAGPPIPGLRFGQLPQMSALTSMVRTDPERAEQVAIGIIDHAIAFAHERFRAFDTKGQVISRVKRIWLQHVERAGPDKPNKVLFGRRLTDIEIARELRKSASASGTINEDAVYAATDAVSFQVGQRQMTAHCVGHGTHVMDLAGGHAPEDDRLDRPLFVVQLPEPTTLDTSGTTLASYALQGLRQIMLWADTTSSTGPLPLVVNFSYGFYAGPKDGTHVIEQDIERLVSHRNMTTPTSIVLPAGNTYLARVTAAMSLAAEEQKSIDWVIHPDCGTPSIVEIWIDGAEASAVAVQLTPPQGGAVGPVSMPTPGAAMVLRDGTRAIGVMYVDEVPSSTTGALPRRRLTIAINPTKAYLDPAKHIAKQPTAPAGAWRISLRNGGKQPVQARLYIQREEKPAGDQPPGRQSYFDHANAYAWDPAGADSWHSASGNYDALGGAACPITHEETLTALATHPARVVVGAAFAGKDGQPPRPSRYTSSGPTPGRRSPDLAAIVDEDRAHLGIQAAGTRSGSIVLLDGTSVAAPQVTRLLADEGADFAALKTKLGLGSGTPDPRLGAGVVPAPVRKHIKARRRT